MCSGSSSKGGAEVAGYEDTMPNNASGRFASTRGREGRDSVVLSNYSVSKLQGPILL